jgi:hypothetical protein
MGKFVSILIVGILASYAPGPPASEQAKAPSVRKAQRQPLSERKVLEIARRAHDTMTTYPAQYTVQNMSAKQQGTNWAVHVFLRDPGSKNPFIGDWSFGGELFQISGDGKVLSCRDLFP